MNRTRNQQGFTLIELIVVIVILGILAATALPKFIDLRGDAAKAAVDGAAGALSSAAAINYGAALAKGVTATGFTAAGGVRLSAADACALIPSLMGSWDTAKFSVPTAGGACATSNAGATISCGVTSKDDTSKSATATVICTG